MANKDSKYIILKGIEQGNVFWSTNTPNESEKDRTKLADGTIAYEILGYADTEQEAIAAWKDYYNGPDWAELMAINMRSLMG